MSKGSKRRSAKYQAKVYKCISREHREPEPAPIKNNAYLNMTNEQIDSTYLMMGKADKTRMKKEAAKERLRILVQNELKKESGNGA